jgi:hypothetical protein
VDGSQGGGNQSGRWEQVAAGGRWEVGGGRWGWKAEGGRWKGSGKWEVGSGKWGEENGAEAVKGRQGGRAEGKSEIWGVWRGSEHAKAAVAVTRQQKWKETEGNLGVKREGGADRVVEDVAFVHLLLAVGTLPHDVFCKRLVLLSTAYEVVPAPFL